MSERMCDAEFEAMELSVHPFCEPASCREKRLALEARRARDAEHDLRGQILLMRSTCGTAADRMEELREDIKELRKERDAERARAEMAESELAGLRESGGALTAAIAQADAALDEFASHHPREDGRHLPFPQCVREAMTTLRGRIATLEAERMELRAALAARTCPAVHASAHGLLVCTREHGHAPPCSWKRRRPEEKCPVCSGACEWDKETTG